MFVQKDLFKMIFFILTKFLGSASFAMNFSVVVQEDNMVGQVYFMVGARTKLWKTDKMETHKSSRYLHNFTSRRARQCPTLDLDLPRIPQYVPPKNSYHNAALPESILAMKYGVRLQIVQVEIQL